MPRSAFTGSRCVVRSALRKLSPRSPPNRPTSISAVGARGSQIAPWPPISRTRSTIAQPSSNRVPQIDALYPAKFRDRLIGQASLSTPIPSNSAAKPRRPPPRPHALHPTPRRLGRVTPYPSCPRKSLLQTAPPIPKNCRFQPYLRDKCRISSLPSWKGTAIIKPRKNVSTSERFLSGPGVLRG